MTSREVSLETHKAGDRTLSQLSQLPNGRILLVQVPYEPACVSSPIAVDPICIPHVLWAAQGWYMKVRNPLNCKALAEGSFGKALLARKRQLPYINDSLHTSFAESIDKRGDIEPLVSERIQDSRIHCLASNLMRLVNDCIRLATLHNEAQSPANRRLTKDLNG
jgi:hypothetical protein